MKTLISLLTVVVMQSAPMRVVEQDGILVTHPAAAYRDNAYIFVETAYGWGRIQELTVFNESTGDGFYLNQIEPDRNGTLTLRLSTLEMIMGVNSFGLEVRLGGKESILLRGIYIDIQ